MSLIEWVRLAAVTFRPRRPAAAGPSAKAPAPTQVESLEGRQLLAATPLRVEVGNSSSYTDVTGRVWSADANFSGGTVSTWAYSVAGTNDDELYQTRRWGNFSYSLPAEDGEYTLKLYFSDPLYTSSGMRKFDVFAEGRQILDDFDVAAGGGGKAATAREFAVDVAGGQLNLTFSKVVENPIVSAIELTPRTGGTPTFPPPPPSDMTASVMSDGRVWLTWKDNSKSETHFRIERSTNGGSFVHVMNAVGDLTSIVDGTVRPNTSYTYRARAVNEVGASAPSDTASVRTPGGPSISWVGSSALIAPIARVEPGGIQVGTKLYIFGGYTDNDLNVTRRLDVFDMATGDWSRRRDIQGPETHAAVATDGRYAYLAGGQYGRGIPGLPTRDVFRYDTTNDTWSRLPSLPAARYLGVLAFLNGRLHYIGGDKEDRVTVAHEHWMLDLSRPDLGWQTRAPVPPGLSGDHQSGAVINGRIYVVGGEHGHSATIDDDAPYIQHDFLLEYDPSTNAWTRKADMPQAQSHMEATVLVINNKIVTVGGQIDDVKVTRAVHLWDPASNAWSTISQLPDRRKGGVAGYHNGRIYYTNGQRDGDYLIARTTYVGTVSGL